MEYYIGDNIKTKAKDITITDKTYKRMADGANRLVYKYKCNICGFDCNEFYYGGEYVIERWFTAFQLERNAKCSCCASKAIKPGINSISTTNPELVEYFVNKHNSEIYSLKSNAHTDMCCPHCGVVKNMCIADLHNQGFSCPRCSDSLSVGERIMYIILSENNISFVKEYVIAGANYRYDFYIKDKNMIIEINGKQHYDGGFGTYDGGKNLEEEKLNDANKKKFALDNGIENYVYIDCRKSNVDYIINSVYDSGIIDILGIENIDENHIAKTIHTHSITKDICDLYNSDDTMSIKDICDILHFDRTTVREHLKSGAKLDGAITAKKHIGKASVMLL